MGIIKAAFSSLGGSLADQWIEVIEPREMGEATVVTPGVKVRGKDGRNGNRKGTGKTISNGSIVHVYPNQMMLLVDGGKVVDYTAEEGYYTVDNATLPSMFNGELQDSLSETFDRFRFGGVTPTAQQVFYVNLQEIKGIKFGTRNAINYFDNFYNAELFLRAFGTYSVKIKDPLKFFMEAIPRNKEQVEINDINEQYLTEFLTALQAAINQMSADGIRISMVTSKSMELAKYMSTVLDKQWSKDRGMEIQYVGIASISYDDESKELINMRNKGAMLQSAGIREGYLQGAAARGIEAAGSNLNGAMAGFVGMNIGMNSADGLMESASKTNRYQMSQEAAQKQESSAWGCSCGQKNTGRFCTQCGNSKPATEAGQWRCKCGELSKGNFCSSCGGKKPEPVHCRCHKCGYEPKDQNNPPKFCPECGERFHEADQK
jgi:membrane protease subunit (stomatin/prohibitin family)